MNQLNYVIQTTIWKHVFNSVFDELLSKRYEFGLCDEVEVIYSRYMCNIITYQEYCDEHRYFEGDFMGDERDSKFGEYMLSDNEHEEDYYRDYVSDDSDG